MKRVSLAELLAIGLRQVDTGSTVDEAVSYALSSAGNASPQDATELRELLQMAILMKPRGGETRVPVTARVDSRKRFLEQAAKIQRPTGAAGLVWTGARIFRAHLASAAFLGAVVIIFLIALGSLKSLPGDELYPVKLAAEQASISLANSDSTRLERQAGFDSRRAEEVAEMIQMKRSGPVNFGGFLISPQANQGWQAAGIPLQLTDKITAQARDLAGLYVEIQGGLDSQGAVQVSSLTPQLFPMRGRIQAIGQQSLTIDGMIVLINSSTQIQGSLRAGGEVSLMVARMADSTRVLAIRGEVIEPVATASQTTLPTETETATPEFTNTTPPKKAPLPSMTDTNQTDDSSVKEHEPEHVTPEPTHSEGDQPKEHDATRTPVPEENTTNPEH